MEDSDNYINHHKDERRDVVLEALKKFNKSLTQEDLDRFAERAEFNRKRQKRYLDKLANLPDEDIIKFIRACMKKYNSDEYRDREYKCGYEPRCPLYSLIMKYAEEYGKPSLYKINEYFPEDQYEILGMFIVSEINGQGTIIDVIEVPDNEPIPHFFQEIPVKIYNNRDELLCETTDQATLVDFQAQVKDFRLEGYYVIYKNEKFMIEKTGRIHRSVNGESFMFGNNLTIAFDNYFFSED